MNAVRKNQVSITRARNAAARYSCGLLLASYFLVAIFTSVPLKTTPHPQEIAQTIDLNLPLAKSSKRSKKWWSEHQRIALMSGKWWQQHQDTVYLHEKWWQRHLPKTAVATSEPSWHIRAKPQQVAAAQKPEPTKNPKSESAHLEAAPKSPLLKFPPIYQAALDKIAPIAVKSKPLARIASLTSKSMVEISIAAIKDHKLPAQAQPKAVATRAAEPELGAKPEVSEKESSENDLPALAKKDISNEALPKLAKIKQSAKISFASLVPFPSSALPIPATTQENFAKYPQSDYEQLLPQFIKTAFKPNKALTTSEPEAAQCVADKIAGWSGIKLLPRHVELLKKSKSASPEISLALAARLSLKGFTPGASIFMRIFKDRSELEVWLKKGERYALYHTYKICRWSGSFGPKLYEGDKQSPEGFYTVNRQLFTRPSWKWKGSFSLGYPNAYDKLHGRTGSLILVHGGCTSSGCFAMTDPVIDEVHELAQLARDNGQQKFSVHVYPFKLTTANLQKHQDGPWGSFWNNLKEGYDLFEETGLPPRVRVCDKRYVFAKGDVERSGDGWSGKGCYGLAAYIPGWKPASRYVSTSRNTSKRLVKRARRTARRARRAGVRVRCNLNRASCRKHVSLKRKKPKQSAVNHLAKNVLLVKVGPAKRRATMRRARTIGRKKKNAYKPFTGGR